jgi:hypothetical protein
LVSVSIAQWFTECEYVAESESCARVESVQVSKRGAEPKSVAVGISVCFPEPQPVAFALGVSVDVPVTEQERVAEWEQLAVVQSVCVTE